MDLQDDPTEQLISELSESCGSYVERALGVRPDLTPETLPLLEHYLESIRPTLQGRDSLLPLMARVVGAYFGEVVRRRFGGFWRLPSENVHDWQLCLEPVFLWVNPVGVAYDALLGSQEHDGPRSQLHVAPEERLLVDQRLAVVPPVPEEEFYWLSTRLEAIEVASEVLHARMVDSGYSEVTFGPEDYAAEFRPL